MGAGVSAVVSTAPLQACTEQRVVAFSYLTEANIDLNKLMFSLQSVSFIAGFVKLEFISNCSSAIDLCFFFNCM